MTVPGRHGVAGLPGTWCCCIGLFTFYLVADGPRLRRTVCSVLPPGRQEVALRVWDLAIESTGSYVYSRALLALPAAASIQALVSIYLHRYEVIASPLTATPYPARRVP
jgi:hypothetical protein